MPLRPEFSRGVTLGTPNGLVVVRHLHRGLQQGPLGDQVAVQRDGLLDIAHNVEVDAHSQSLREDGLKQRQRYQLLAVDAGTAGLWVVGRNCGYLVAHGLEEGRVLDNLHQHPRGGRDAV